MFICQCCKIRISSETVPGKCPKCPNSDAEKFENVSEPEPEKIKRVCSNCENEVMVSDTTGECPLCNQNAVFTEPEHDTPGLKAVDRYAGETIVVDPDNVLVDDSETDAATD